MKKLLGLLTIALLFIGCEKEAILNSDETIKEETEMIEKPLNPFVIADLLGYYEYAPHPETGQTVRKVDWGRLCTHQNINKWSKYKPVKVQGENELSESKFASVNFGISFPSFSNVEDLINFYENDGKWEYLRPLGGETSPFRISDFNGYDHEASKFFYFRDLPENVYKDDSELTVRMDQFSLKPNLDWGDFSFGSGLENTHFGALIVQNFSLNEFQQQTADYPLQQSNIVDIPFTGIPKTGRYKVMTYVAEVLGNTPTTYYPLDGGFLGDFLFETSPRLLIITLEGVVNEQLGSVIWTLNIENNGYQTNLLRNVSVSLRYADNNPIDPLEIGESEQYLGDINIGNPYTQTGTFIGFNEFASRGGYMYFSHSNIPDYSGKHSLIIP